MSLQWSHSRLVSRLTGCEFYRRIRVILTNPITVCCKCIIIQPPAGHSTVPPIECSNIWHPVCLCHVTWASTGFIHQEQLPFNSQYTGQPALASTSNPIFCWCKVLLPTCPCLRPPAHSIREKTLEFSSTVLSILSPYSLGKVRISPTLTGIVASRPTMLTNL